MKRVMDVFCSVILLTLLSPVMVVIVVLLRFTIGSPVLFQQQRSGISGKPFLLYKFRTMNEEVDQDGNPLPDAQRLTKVGKVIRKYSLDELPQLINVLKGEMSLVGPRPLLMEYLSLYTEEQFLRHLVKPGVTGWAQVNGRNAITWEEKFSLDIWYVKNKSLHLDCQILFLTMITVLKKEGINQKDSASAIKFKGSKLGDPP